MTYRLVFRLVNVARSAFEYQADIEFDGEIVGSVERTMGKGGGYRDGDYIARIGRWKVGSGRTLAELDVDLRLNDCEAIREGLAEQEKARLEEDAL